MGFVITGIEKSMILSAHKVEHVHEVASKVSSEHTLIKSLLEGSLIVVRKCKSRL
jgi:hypothetical protein